MIWYVVFVLLKPCNFHMNAKWIGLLETIFIVVKAEIQTGHYW